MAPTNPKPESLQPTLRSTFKAPALMLVVGMTILGLGVDTVQLDCTPSAAAGSGSSVTTTPVQLQCDYHASRLWGIWTTHAGTVHDVLALEGDRGRSAKGGDTWALELRTPQGKVTVSTHAAAPIAPKVFQSFEANQQIGKAFTVRALQIDRGVALLSSVFLALGLIFFAAFPVFLRPMPAAAVGEVRPTGWQHWWRIGRDDSFIQLGIFVIPVWLGLVALYFLGCFAMVSMADWLPPNVSTSFAGSGPALLGLIDLIRRLRTVEYYSTTPLGLEVTHHASLVDRLTFRECGWYLPLLNAPIPLWLLGGAITLIILTM